MRRSLVPLSGALVLWGAVSCLDISSPIPGIGSISRVISPFPSVVVGDTLRDTTGTVIPLRVVAFAPNGDTVRDERVEFFVLDTTGGLVVDSNGVARGVKVSLRASVVARVTSSKGGASLQTDTLSLPVVPVPAQLMQTSPADTTLNFDIRSTDTLTGNLSPPLSVKLVAHADTAVPSYLVHYTIESAPAGTPGKGLLVTLANASGKDSAVAITGQDGSASRYVRLRLVAIDSAVLAGAESVVVRASATLRGQPLDSIARFVVHLKPKF